MSLGTYPQIVPDSFASLPHTLESALKALAEERQARAQLERENTELRGIARNGKTDPARRTIFTGLFYALEEQRARAGSDTFTVDYFDLTPLFFERPWNPDPSIRSEETKKAKDKAGRYLRDMHERRLLHKGKPKTKAEEQEDGSTKYTVEGIEITLTGSLLQNLHRLATYDDSIPVKKPRGKYAVEVQCGKCGSTNITYDCHNCGAVNQPINGATIVKINVPDDDAEPEKRCVSGDSQSLRTRSCLRKVMRGPTAGA